VQGLPLLGIFRASGQSCPDPGGHPRQELLIHGRRNGRPQCRKFLLGATRGLPVLFPALPGFPVPLPTDNTQAPEWGCPNQDQGEENHHQEKIAQELKLPGISSINQSQCQQCLDEPSRFLEAASSAPRS